MDLKLAETSLLDNNINNNNNYQLRVSPDRLGRVLLTEGARVTLAKQAEGPPRSPQASMKEVRLPTRRL